MRGEPMASLMPQLPDITIYIEALERRIIGQRLDAVAAPTPRS